MRLAISILFCALAAQAQIQMVCTPESYKSARNDSLQLRGVIAYDCGAFNYSPAATSFDPVQAMITMPEIHAISTSRINDAFSVAQKRSWQSKAAMVAEWIAAGAAFFGGQGIIAMSVRTASDLGLAALGADKLAGYLNTQIPSTAAFVGQLFTTTVTLQPGQGFQWTVWATGSKKATAVGPRFVTMPMPPPTLPPVTSPPAPSAAPHADLRFEVPVKGLVVFSEVKPDTRWEVALPSLAFSGVAVA